MKFYDIDSVFTFGKYEGMTIAEVYEKDPKYIKYCEENIDEFYVSPSVKRELKSLGRAASASSVSSSGHTVSAVPAQRRACSDQEISWFWQKGQRKLQPKPPADRIILPG